MVLRRYDVYKEIFFSSLRHRLLAVQRGKANVTVLDRHIRGLVHPGKVPNRYGSLTAALQLLQVWLGP